MIHFLLSLLVGGSSGGGGGSGGVRTLLVRVRERVATDLSDAELLDMIAGCELELDERLGPDGPIVVPIGDPTDPASRFNRTLRLPRPADIAQAITVVEIDPGNTGQAEARITLDAADFAVLHGGRTLQRLTGGTNGRDYWAPLVEVTYSPPSQAAKRAEAIIKLVQLDLSYRGGLKSERAGDYQFTLSGDPAADREAILQGLATRQGMVLA